MSNRSAMLHLPRCSAWGGQAAETEISLHRTAAYLDGGPCVILGRRCTVLCQVSTDSPSLTWRTAGTGAGMLSSSACMMQEILRAHSCTACPCTHASQGIAVHCCSLHTAPEEDCWEICLCLSASSALYPERTPR